MISVCMAVRNGAPYIAEQIHSILSQLDVNDELIISDDQSEDESISVINSIRDARIKLFTCSGKGVIANFENALRHASGDYVFLSDQDDMWVNGKISLMCLQLKTYGLVVCDCIMADKNLKPESQSFFELNGSGKGILKNLIRNSYMGCCMAFNQTLLKKILPMPPQISMHDQWIGLVAELHSTVLFLPEKLVYHRRHNSNASTTFQKSTNSFSKKMSMRFHLLKNLISRSQ